MACWYKPFALRSLCLIAFFATFCIYIGLIEWLLAHSGHSDRPSQSSTSTQLRTILCSRSEQFSTQLANLESLYSSMCSGFSETFAPSPTRNDPTLQAVFQGWSITFHSVMSTSAAIRYSSSQCHQSTAKPSPSSSPYTDPHLTIGCTSIPLKSLGVSPANCGYQTTFDMSNGVLINSWYVPTCSMSSEQMLVITEPPTSISGVSATTTYYSKIETTDKAGKPTTVGRYVTSLVAPTAPLRANFTLSASEVRLYDTFTEYSYFLAIFLAPMLAVLVRGWWEIIHASFKLVEPFQKLGKDRGALVNDSFLSQYLSSTMSLQTIRALKNDTFQTVWSLAVYALIHVSTLLASAAMSLRAQNMCLIDGHPIRCNPAWVIDLPMIRSLEAVLATCAALVGVLIARTFAYGLALPGNPSSIASIASLLCDEALLHIIQETDPEANEQSLADALAGHRCILGRRHNAPAQAQLRLAIRESSKTYDPSSPHKHLLESTSPENNTIRHTVAGNCSSLARGPDYPDTQGRSWLRPLHIRNMLPGRNKKGLADFASDLLCLAAVTTLLALLIAYYLDGSSSHFNNFFNSQSAFAKIVLVGIAVIADIEFKNLERAVRVTEPYRRLSLGHARPETTILFPLNGTCWSNLPRCVYYLTFLCDSRMLYQTVVSMVACLSDFNIIMVSGVLFSDAQTVESLRACWSVSVAITSTMLLVVVVSLVWWRRVAVISAMPRRPETIGAVISYLCGSVLTRELAQGRGMISDKPFATLSEKDRWNAIIRSGRKFRFGRWVSPIDERVRWCVEFESDVVRLSIDEDGPTSTEKRRGIEERHKTYAEP